MRILIVRLSALGDTALTVPLLLALREAYPAAKIGWVVEELSAPLLASLLQLDVVHVWRKSEKSFRGAWRMARLLKAEGYDVSLDAQGLTKSAILPWLAGIPKRIGFARAPLEARELAPNLNNIRIAPPSHVRHIRDRTLHLLSGLGLEVPTPPLPTFPVDPDACARMRAWWEDAGLGGQRTICFGVSSSWVTKIWPVESMRVIVDRARAAGYRCILTWGPGDAAALPGWLESLGDGVRASPPTEALADLVALLSLASRYAGPDSAPLHLAWLLGKPTCSWFGPSDSERGGPYGAGQARVVAHPPTRQREGSMLALSPETVLPVFEAWLRDESGEPHP